MAIYHNEQWRVSKSQAAKLFDLITLEGAQVELRWQTKLSRREGYRNEFANFDLSVIATFAPVDVNPLLLNPSII